MIIAERCLYIKTEADPIPVPITLYAPVDDDNHWRCEYAISWPEGMRRFNGCGADAVQALILALEMIGIELYTSAYHKEDRLRSAGLESGYGFPVAANCRDLLVGHDRENF
jgi:hypothetical protein